MVAIAVIGVLVAGLAYFGFAPGAEPVSVPSGAKAGDLILKPCSYATEQGRVAADCGTLVVPENRAEPGSRLIALPVTRIRARSGHPGEPIFRLEGGPGITNMTFPQASRFAADHDVVLDAQVVGAYYAAGGDPGSILGNAGTDHLWGGGGMVRGWPATPGREEFTRVRPSAVETLLVGGTLDFSTPSENATRELLPHLSNGHQVVLAELGHTSDFWTYQPEAGNRLINTFFDSGKVDDSAYTRRAMDFGTGVTFSALAKGILGTMLGFAILAVLSLLWMPYRVHKRGRFGPKASAWLRSVYSLVIGLGDGVLPR
jgi:hypothetical protein